MYVYKAVTQCLVLWSLPDKPWNIISCLAFIVLGLQIIFVLLIYLLIHDVNELFSPKNVKK